MSIVKDYIEKNAELLNNLVGTNRDLAQSLADALAVLDAYADSNNITFDENEKSKLLNEPFKEIVNEAAQEEVEDVEASLKFQQSIASAEQKVIEYSVLQLAYIEENELTINTTSFARFQEQVRIFAYNDSISNLPTQGYDKYRISFGWGIEGTPESVVFLNQRIDVSSRENNPFTSPNIVLQDFITSFTYGLRYYWYGIEKDYLNRDIKKNLIEESFCLSCLDWQVSKEDFKLLLLRWTYYQLERDTEDLRKIKPGLHDKLATATDIMNLLKEWLPKDFYEYIFDLSTTPISIVVKNDIGINKENMQQTYQLFLESRLTQQNTLANDASIAQVSTPNSAFVTPTQSSEKEYEVMTTKFKTEAERIVELASEKNIGGVYYYNDDYQVYVIQLDEYLQVDSNLSKRTKEILEKQARMTKSTLESRYPQSGVTKPKKSRATTQGTTPIPITHESKVFLEDIEESDIKALESIGDIEDEDLQNFNLDDLDI
jgi:hypothetical protein